MSLDTRVASLRIASRERVVTYFLAVLCIVDRDLHVYSDRIGNRTKQNYVLVEEPSKGLTAKNATYHYQVHHVPLLQIKFIVFIWVQIKCF